MASRGKLPHVSRRSLANRRPRQVVESSVAGDDVYDLPAETQDEEEESVSGVGWVGESALQISPTATYHEGSTIVGHKDADDIREHYASSHDGIYDVDSVQPRVPADNMPGGRYFMHRHVVVWNRVTGLAEEMPSCEEAREAYRAAFDEGPEILIDQWIRENDGYGVVPLSSDLMSIAVDISDILFSTFPDILEALLAGNLPELRHTIGAEQNALRAALDHNYQRAMHNVQCCVYMHAFVNKISGCGPTYDELEDLLTDIDRYQTDDAFANQIDNVVGYGVRVQMAQSSRGVRRYIENDNQRHTLQKFADALAERIIAELQSVDRSRDDIMPAPLAEFGFTINANDRKLDHDRHDESNHVMNLMDALSRVRFRGNYCMDFFVVYCAPKPELSPYAEAFFTSIGQGYVYNGGGFNDHAGGVNTTTYELVKPEDAKAGFDWVEMWVGMSQQRAAYYQRQQATFDAVQAELREARETNAMLDEYLAAKAAVAAKDAGPATLGQIEACRVAAERQDILATALREMEAGFAESEGEGWEAKLEALYQGEEGKWAEEEASIEAGQGDDTDELLRRLIAQYNPDEEEE